MVLISDWEGDREGGGHRAVCPTCHRPLSNWPSVQEAALEVAQHQNSEHPIQLGGDAGEEPKGGKRRGRK
jgi:hypothetical protein